MSVKLEIPQSEIDKAVKQVEAWQIRKRNEVLDLIERTAKAIAATAKQNVPVDEGKLQKAIRADLSKLEQEMAAHVVAGDRKAFHGHLVERGTVKTKAQPFLVPAYEQHLPGFWRELQNILSSA